ncbi:MAG: gluconokinase [Proteobacteria bacterium]|nr:gluconokinase [Pseudomonadota bacterium]
MKQRAIIVMGVSGCGKSTLAARLAEALSCPFLEGDALHPKANIDRMSAGLPLRDEDRWPWLDEIARAMNAKLESGASVVASCSSLRLVYRDRFRANLDVPPLFFWLDGSRELLAARMSSRPGHFMPTTLLDSQLATLERPEGEADVVRIELSLPLEDMLAQAQTALTVRA